MIVTTYCTAQSLILQLISSDELLVLLWVSVIEVTLEVEGVYLLCCVLMFCTYTTFRTY